MKKVSIILHYSGELVYNDAKFNEIINSLIEQNYQNWEIVLIDHRGNGENYPNIIKHDNIIHLPGNFKNKATAINAAISKASGDYIMLVDNLDYAVIFRLSTLEIFTMVANKNPNMGLLYSDYQAKEKTGTTSDVHLLDYHKGRLMDSADFGPVFFIPTKIMKAVQGLNENLDFSELYNLRLKISAQYDIVHINAAVNGYTYVVEMNKKKEDIFGYLKKNKKYQLEFENTLVAHLKQIGAFLEPGMHYREIEYSKEELDKFDECVASVVIPVFNRKEFIGIAIDSVQAQTVQNIEVIIVVNGGPSDPTIEGVKPYLEGGEKYDPNKPAVKLFIEDINNLGFCLNKGINNARGKYYIQLDSDDQLKPDAVEKIIKVFDSDKSIGMVIGSYEIWEKDDETGKLYTKKDIKVVTHDEWTEENGRNNLLRINGAGAPRSAHIKMIQNLGGFGMNDSDQCRNYGEDYDLVLRTSEQYRIGRVWDPIYKVIRHSGGTDHNIDQITIDRNNNAKDHMRKEAIERRIKINAK